MKHTSHYAFTLWIIHSEGYGKLTWCVCLWKVYSMWEGNGWYYQNKNIGNISTASNTKNVAEKRSTFIKWYIHILLMPLFYIQQKCYYCLQWWEKCINLQTPIKIAHSLWAKRIFQKVRHPLWSAKSFTVR